MLNRPQKLTKTKNGFTIIEFLLAMSFFSTLLISIAFLISYLTVTYQKGITIKNVNSVGRHIVREISDAIAASPSRPANLVCRDKIQTGGANIEKCNNDQAYKYTFYQKYSNVRDKTTNQIMNVPVYGALCTGRYSFIWNSGYFYNPEFVVENINKATLDGYNDLSGNPKDIKLLKVFDIKRNICASHVNDGYDYRIPTNKSASDPTHPKYSLLGTNKTNLSYDGENFKTEAQTHIDNAVELIGKSTQNVAIYDMRIFQPAIHSTTRQALYSGTFVLATTMGRIDLTGLGEYCKEPADGFISDFAYCSLNKFNFAARALGKMQSDEQQERNIYEKE